MTRHLIENVHVAGRSFAAGDVPGDEYADQITNPKVWSDYEPPTKGLESAKASGPGEPSSDPGGDNLFDPAADGNGVDEVNNHLAEADEDEVTRVLALEAAGKKRKGILEGPYAPEA